ncbi:MAG: hypothetical protein K2J20_01645, partial [Bacilli bacterium]|nr:hypothetical protein [Bacilli bacterium]
MDDYIQAMHAEIEGLFAKIADIDSALASFKDEVSSINDSAIINAYNELKKNNDAGKPIVDIQEAISELRKLINNYKKEHEFIDKNRPLLDEMYMIVSSNFNQAMTYYNRTLDFESMTKALEFYAEFISYYQAITKQEFDVAAISMLSNLTFRNFDADNNILNVVCKTSGSLVNKIYIYMNILDFSRPKINVLSASADGRRYYMRGINAKGEQMFQLVAYSDIDDQYISLDEFINKAKYFGKHGYGYTESDFYTILYFYQDYMICLDEDGSIKICNKISFRKYVNAVEAEPY